MNAGMMALSAFCLLCGIMIGLMANKETSCHTFQRTDTSHIRLNSCTGEAHVIVRGPNGFEWQRVND